MITSTQITNTDLFAFIVVLVFKLLSRDVLHMKKQQKLLKSRLPGNFTHKLLQNYK